MDGAQFDMQRVSARITAPGCIETVRDTPADPGPGEVRVRIEGCGVCASNLTPWAGPDWMEFPLAPGELGHEAWGHIDATGPGVPPERQGERVALFGSHGFSSHELVPADAAIPVPAELAGKPAPAEPLACALSIFRMARVAPGDRVAIIGIGFLGALLTQMASRAGAEVIAISRRAESLALARGRGAASTIALDDHARVLQQVGDATGGAGCDISIECTGHQWPLDLAAEITRESGRLVIAGYHQDGPRQVNMQLWNWRALDIVNAHVRDRATILATMRDALDAWARGDIDPLPLFTHSYPLDRLDEALDATRDKPQGFVKALVTMRDTPGVRLGFLGLGWIGRHRMQALAGSPLAEVIALSDPDAGALTDCLATAPRAQAVDGLDALLATRPDGVVIATPSGQHAAQTIAALDAGAAVFCQKPLGRTAAEVRQVLDAARRNDRLLQVDLSYRHTAAARALRAELRSGRLGTPGFVDLVFHNAYGPDKPWFFDRTQSGGGCLIDLGTHLVDLALWLLDWPEVECRAATLRCGGAPLPAGGTAVEDFAVATLETSGGVPIRLCCSWNMPAGRDAIIGAEIYGTGGGAGLHNVDGSFLDLQAQRFDGCQSTQLAAPPDDWGGRAALAWLDRLSRDPGFDPDCERLETVVQVLDGIYAKAGVARDAA